jgi:exonuclease III
VADIDSLIIRVLIIHNTVRDTEGNFILLDVEHFSKRYTIGSVYGCNTNEGINMYDNLQTAILGLKNESIVLGGDWNASFACSPVNENIDVLNMANIPSFRRSNRISELCLALNLTDPYRILYPNTREYTFIPSGDRQHNRSRLDFFIISCDLSEQVKNVIIPHSLKRYCDEKFKG